jgi:rSAM/selenodomain-associated transferase 2/rSAM/selenodomain-associated transferase 1
MTNTPRLSIIMPTLNEGAQIAARLADVQDLRERGVEIIVCDGGSTDETVRLARPLCDALAHAPRGRASQMNAGARIARGDVLLFLHADTRLPLGEAQHLDVDLRVSGRAWGRFDVTIEGRSRLLPLVAFCMNLRSAMTGIATGDQAIFMTRAAFETIGGFPDLPLMEDIAASRLLKRIGPPLRVRAKARTSGRRWDSKGALRTILLMWSLRLAYFLGADPEALARRYGYAPVPDPRPAPAAMDPRAEIPVAVFARAPAPGAAKTRLIPLLGEKGAAQLHARLVERALASARAAEVGPVTLWRAPEQADHPFFAQCLSMGATTLATQRGADLGARMLAAFEARAPLLLMGSDCPSITPQDIAWCAQALRAGADAVFLPAEDGGYGLIGARAPLPELFRDMTWGDASVMERTRARARAAGLVIAEGRVIWDVDRPEDHARLMREGLIEPAGLIAADDARR